MKKIGFIGIGLMGFPMAKNILKSGYSLKVFNRSLAKAEALEEFGAEIAKTVEELVKDSDVVITMLTDDKAVDEVMSSSSFLENLKPGLIVIDMSSIKQKKKKKIFSLIKMRNNTQQQQKKRKVPRRVHFLLL